MFATNTYPENLAGTNFRRVSLQILLDWNNDLIEEMRWWNILNYLARPVIN